MNEQHNNPLSPTVTKVLDEYLDTLLADEALGDALAKQLDALLRTGKVPKIEDIDTALSPLPKGGNG
ncbi:hypothetical protein [Chelativorans sp. AA-79]|uniref:hypothetical protein n=1 Tax=Chelativorans sp. AA-79 TaxID=3028735 RepID=UPI0023FA3CDA|nr:hypothetical protein [Chelativorans sp. AA-79]WEX11693.1 hypothetical protein PVE73_12575 [Chelativorans sp. AA-79]